MLNNLGGGLEPVLRCVFLFLRARARCDALRCCRHRQPGSRSLVYRQLMYSRLLAHEGFAPAATDGWEDQHHHSKLGVSKKSTLPWISWTSRQHVPRPAIAQSSARPQRLSHDPRSHRRNTSTVNLQPHQSIIIHFFLLLSLPVPATIATFLFCTYPLACLPCTAVCRVGCADACRRCTCM
ncbi:hypothetical protein DM02DRAFT_12555 [Periconia macrospinosa]|uniref:Uncharacterized protein n=1 Tax=Periconia macrospinosa TaxID=97972 RepID=A0A2V1EG62_9PLEO|nr:hypothetical protein DM02DRAFT_12555 [Periconia macrospinosa]